MMKRKNQSLTTYDYKVVFAGIFLTILGAYVLWDSIAIQSRLKEIKGTFQSGDVHIGSKQYKSRAGSTPTQYAELTFYLTGHNNKFYLSREIGNAYDDKEYKMILAKMKNADSISVWVRPRDRNDYQPKIFQITGGGRVILDFGTVRTENGFLPVLLLMGGLTFLILFLKKIFSNQWNKLWNKILGE